MASLLVILQRAGVAIKCAQHIDGSLNRYCERFLFSWCQNKKRFWLVNYISYIICRCPYTGKCTTPLRWRHNDHSNHQPHGCLLNRLFRRRWKKTSKLRVTGLCVGNSPGPVNSPHKGPVTRKMFPFDDVIMQITTYCRYNLIRLVGSIKICFDKPEYFCEVNNVGAYSQTPSAAKRFTPWLRMVMQICAMLHFLRTWPPDYLNGCRFVND